VLHVVALWPIDADELPPLPTLEQVDEYRGEQEIEYEGDGTCD
jgi:hypothetical protein